jgi:hypothetical protein
VGRQAARGDEQKEEAPAGLGATFNRHFVIASSS